MEAVEEFLGTQVPERPPAGTMQKLQGPCIVDEPVKVQKPYRLILKKWVKKVSPVKKILRKLWHGALARARHNRRARKNKKAVARPPSNQESTTSSGSDTTGSASSVAGSEASSGDEEEEEVEEGEIRALGPDELGALLGDHDVVVAEGDRLITQGNDLIQDSRRLVVEWHSLVDDTMTGDDSMILQPQTLVYYPGVYSRHPTTLPPHTFLQNRHSQHQFRYPVPQTSLDIIPEYRSLDEMMSSLHRDESITPPLMASPNPSTRLSIQPSTTATPAVDSSSEQTEEKEAALSRSPSMSPETARRRYGMVFPATQRGSILPGNSVCYETSVEGTTSRSPAESRSPSTSRIPSTRRFDEGSRIPRPVPFQTSDSFDPRGRAESTFSDSDDSTSTVKTRTAIPVRIQRENDSVRMVPQDNQSTFHAGGARLVNVTQSSGVSQTSGQTSTLVPSDLDTFDEQTSPRTSVDTTSIQQRMGPTLRISSAAERTLRGSRSVSFAKFTEARQSGKVYYPRTIRGDTPPSDEDNDNHSQTSSPQTERKSSRPPPRASSLSALGDVAAQQAARVDMRVLHPASKSNVSFDDIVTKHPEMEDVVIHSGVVKVGPPRVARVFDSLRSVLSLGRAERRGQTSFTIVEKRPRSSIPRSARPSTGVEVQRTLEKARSEVERPVDRLGRPGMMPSIEQIRVALNSVGRELVESESREAREVWFREFVHLHTLLVQYEALKASTEAAAKANSIEVGSRRNNLLREVDSMWKRHEGLDCEGVSSEEITTEF